jgi:hypothetical protein
MSELPTLESLPSMGHYHRDNVITASADWVVDTYPPDYKGVVKEYDYLVYLQADMEEAEQDGQRFFCVHSYRFFAFARHKKTKAWASITKHFGFRNELSVRVVELFFRGGDDVEFEAFWKRNGSSMPGSLSLYCPDGGSKLFSAAGSMLDDDDWVKSQLEPSLDDDRIQPNTVGNGYGRVWTDEYENSSPFVNRTWALRIGKKEGTELPVCKGENCNVSYVSGCSCKKDDL